MESAEVPRSPEHMFALFESCAKEAENIVLERNENGEIIAPNGLVSKLEDELLCRIVRTQAFKNWFGDWENDPSSASQVRYPETGEPRLVFHSTPADIPMTEGLRGRMEKQMHNNMNMIYFAIDRNDSLSYGEWRKRLFYDHKPEATASAYPCFLNIRNQAKDHKQLGIIDDTTDIGGSIHYAVGYNSQIMHVPFSVPGNGDDQE